MWEEYKIWEGPPATREGSLVSSSKILFKTMMIYFVKENHPYNGVICKANAQYGEHLKFGKGLRPPVRLIRSQLTKLQNADFYHMWGFNRAPDDKK